MRHEWNDESREHSILHKEQMSGACSCVTLRKHSQKGNVNMILFEICSGNTTIDLHQLPSHFNKSIRSSSNGSSSSSSGNSSSGSSSSSNSSGIILFNILMIC